MQVMLLSRSLDTCREEAETTRSWTYLLVGRERGPREEILGVFPDCLKELVFILKHFQMCQRKSSPTSIRTLRSPRGEIRNLAC